jgi:4-hydroxy-3-polyprenylbenzoate decarboxylase
MGGIVYPPLPCFYHRPQTIADIIDHTVSRVIDLLGIPHTMAPRWEGLVEATQHNLAGG